MKTVEGLYYSESHEWVKVDGEIHFVDPDHIEEFFIVLIMGSWK